MRIPSTYFGPAELKICVFRLAAGRQRMYTRSHSIVLAAYVADRPNCNWLIPIQLRLTAANHDTIDAKLVVYL